MVSLVLAIMCAHRRPEAVLPLLGFRGIELMPAGLLTTTFPSSLWCHIDAVCHLVSLAMGMTVG